MLVDEWMIFDLKYMPYWQYDIVFSPHFFTHNSIASKGHIKFTLWVPEWPDVVPWPWTPPVRWQLPLHLDFFPEYQMYLSSYLLKCVHVCVHKSVNNVSKAELWISSPLPAPQPTSHILYHIIQSESYQQTITPHLRLKTWGHLCPSFSVSYTQLLNRSFALSLEYILSPTTSSHSSTNPSSPGKVSSLRGQLK